ncbi:44693_t:CDS:2 [Gigaspora margarita]|uniref:44693_t:CDS:1 n=1 Tax=Gigaspora margarita TaxID=4874 RepID=A0ABN7X0V8_GIGMA|nr:44693_t:CDS:2 [Gigaspora margarita]
MSTNDSTTPKTNDTTTPKINDSTTTLGLIIVILPKSSILPPQPHSTQDLDKKYLIPIVYTEIEETDMVNDLDYDPDKEHNLDNYMWFGAGDTDCSDQERYDRGEIE